MILAAALTTAPAAAPRADQLSAAIRHFRSVESYRVTIRSTHAKGEEHLRYYYKRPGFVRMEFIRPYAGAVMVYSPNTQRVRIWPFGADTFPELSLSPENMLIRSWSGSRIDRSDIGTLLENIRLLREHGKAETLDKEVRNGHTVLHLMVTGGEAFAVDGVHSSELWLDAQSQAPLKVISRDMHGSIIETVTLEALKIDGKLPASLFDPP